MAHNFDRPTKYNDDLIDVQSIIEIALVDKVEHKTNCTTRSANSSNINETREDDTERKLLQNLADDYRKKTGKINSVLKKAGFLLESFPMEFQEQVNNIAELAIALNVKDPSTTSLLLGSYSLQNKMMKLKEEEMRQDHSLSKLTRRMEMVAKLNQEIQKELHYQQNLVRKLEKTEEDIKKGIQFFELKCKEYIKEDQKLQASLNKAGAVPMLYHGELLKDSQELKKLEKEFDILTLKLQRYHDLPPDKGSSQNKVNEAREELQKLEKKFEESQNITFRRR